MGCGLSGLTDRRTHTHSATRAPPGPTRTAQFCAGCIVHRSRSSRPPASSRATAPRAPAPRAVRAIPKGKGVRPGGPADLGRPWPRTEQPRQQVTAGRGPLASGRAGRGWWTGFARLPVGAGPGLTPGSSLGRSDQSPAAQAWFFSGPSRARLQPRPAHAPGPVGKGQRRAKASRPDSSPPGPAPRPGRPTGPPKGGCLQAGLPWAEARREENNEDRAVSNQPRAVPMFSCQSGSSQGQTVLCLGLSELRE